MIKTFTKAALAVACATMTMPVLSLPASAHIDLISPKPLVGGRVDRGRALKVHPFGAPGVDPAEEPSTEVESGSVLQLDLNHYVYHPGDIVVLWTTDPEGKDVMPAMTIPSMDTPVPHNNWLAGMTAPCSEETGCKVARTDIPFSMWVKLPEVKGDIYLVVRQVMHDKFDQMDNGSVGLSRIYYHQTAKLTLK